MDNSYQISGNLVLPYASEYYAENRPRDIREQVYDKLRVIRDDIYVNHHQITTQLNTIDQYHQISLQKIVDLSNRVQFLENQVSAIRLQIPVDRVLYINIESERISFIRGFMEDLEQMSNYADLFCNLIRGLSPGDIETVVRVIKRIIQVATSEEQMMNIYSLEEQGSIRDLWDHFDKNILKLSDSLYSYYQYLLPYNNFNPSVLYYRHGMDTLQTLNYISSRDIIDAGAFIGDSALVLSPYTNKNVYSFEPIEQNANYFKQTMELNHMTNVVLEQRALSNKTGTLPIYLTEDLDANSVLKPNRADNEAVLIPCITLDQYVQQHNLQVGLIKADVEGAEQFILEGAMDTIRRFRPTLLLSMYHTAEQFFGLKPMIEKWDLGYTFRIYRPAMLNVLTDTILIAECQDWVSGI